MPTITDEQVALAHVYGHRFDIGQLTKEEKKQYAQQIRQGTVIKVKAMWPWLTWGTRAKTCYVTVQ